jgi:hypothetical protein
MSAFVWLDYSERERRKMLDVIDVFREHGSATSLALAPFAMPSPICSSPARARS